MGMADVIVDLVSSGTTLRENNLKEIKGGVILESQVSSHAEAWARKVPSVVPFA
jgi:ATP phosphoribosyltransferase